MSRVYRVIDADGHVLEPFSLWTEYMEPAYRDRAPRMVRDRDGRDRFLLGEETADGSTDISLRRGARISHAAIPANTATATTSRMVASVPGSIAPQ